MKKIKVKIKPYIKIPWGMQLFLGSYLNYAKKIKESPPKYKNFEDRITNYLIIVAGETVKFIFTAFAFAIAVLKFKFGVKIKGIEKYLD